MAIIPIDQLGRIGVVKDVNPAMLAPEAWTDARNVLFERGVVSKSGRWVPRITPEVEPYGLWVFTRPGISFYVYAGLEKVYAVYGNAQHEITRSSGPYTGTSADQWTASMFNGIPILNNGVDPPQAWDPMELNTRLVDLPNWPTGTRAKVVRPFRNFLVALNVNFDPRLVKWSHSAPPGTLPSSWDPLDPTTEAGEVSLGQGDDKLVDCAPLGGVNVIYGETSMTAMSVAPLPFVFSFNNISSSSGVISVDCVQEFNRLHFVLTLDDVIVFDGASIRSVAEGRIRRWLFANIEPSAFQACRVLKNARQKEMWVFFPERGSSVLTRAAIWNWAYDTWTVVDVPATRAVAQQYAVVGSAADIWGVDVDIWDSDQTVWNYGAPSEATFLGRFLLASLIPPSIQTYESFTPTDFESRVERVGLDLEPRGWVKQCLGVWPVINAPQGARFLVSVGTQMTPDQPPSWKPEKLFVVGEGPKLDIYATGRYLALSVRDVPPVAENWELLGVKIEVTRTGLL